MMTRQEASKIIEQYRMCSSGDCPTLECADCEYNHDPRKVEEAFLMAIDALESAQPEPCEYAVSAMAVEEMLKDLLPERGMWEIEGDEAKTAICETVHDALDGLWKLPFVKPDSKELSFTQKALDTISRQAAIDAAHKNYDTILDFKSDGRTVADSFEDIINALPSAQPEQKKGKWIYGEHDVTMCDGYWCNKCGFFVPWDYKHKSIDYIKDYHFCPNCGVKMENDGGEPGC